MGEKERSKKWWYAGIKSMPHNCPVVNESVFEDNVPTYKGKI